MKYIEIYHEGKETKEIIERMIREGWLETV